MTDYDSWAWLYDRTLGPDYRDRKMGFLDRVLLSRLPAGAHVLDLCCGTGQMMAPMLARGFRVTGIDMSEDMLAHARRNAPGADLIRADARDFRLEGQVDGAVCASASLNHMATAADLAAVFACVHAALRPGGTFVFDINHPAQMERHWRGALAAGDIRADHAWSITPRYDATRREGAFRVDMHRRPAAGGTSSGPRPWLALLRRPILRRTRNRRLAAFARRHADWEHRGIDYPVHGHALDEVARLLRESGFEPRVETPDGHPEIDEDSAACFLCRRDAAESREAAE